MVGSDSIYDGSEVLVVVGYLDFGVAVVGGIYDCKVEIGV